MLAGDIQGGVRLAARGREDALGAGMPEYRWRRHHSWSLLARGDKERAIAVEEEIGDEQVQATDDVFEDDAQWLVRLHLMLGDVDGALRVAERYPHSTWGSESPLEAASAARLAFQSMAAALPAGVTPPAGLLERARDALAMAMEGRTDEWRAGAHGLELAIAAGFARRLAGEPAIAYWHGRGAAGRPRHVRRSGRSSGGEAGQEVSGAVGRRARDGGSADQAHRPRARGTAGPRDRRPKTR